MDNSTIDEDGIRGEITGTVCPTQAEGTVDGQFFYFRARWGDWTLAISDTAQDAVRTAMDFGDSHGWSTWGPDGTYGEMPVAEVWDEVRAGVARWRSKRDQTVTTQNGSHTCG